MGASPVPGPLFLGRLGGEQDAPRMEATTPSGRAPRNPTQAQRAPPGDTGGSRPAVRPWDGPSPLQASVSLCVQWFGLDFLN